jgi:hypothetical protein
MADLKISQLTSATLPLAGTEVLPIVQSSSTKKVATDDLTVKNVRSNATTGILQVAGPATAATRIMTVPDANFTAARTDAAQSFTGDQTLSTGNLIIGTSGKGIDFSATPGTGTSELLADYEEGTWTPTDASGAGLSFTATSNNCFYTKIGNQVTCVFSLTYPSTASAAAATIGGLPFTSKNTSASVAGGFTTFTSNGSDVVFLIGANDTIVGIRSITGISGVTNVSLTTAQIRGVLQYLV